MKKIYIKLCLFFWNDVYKFRSICCCLYTFMMGNESDARLNNDQKEEGEIYNELLPEVRSIIIREFLS